MSGNKLQSPAGKPLPALVTGASGGIGADLARVFARNGHALALVARSGDKLAVLKAELTATHGVAVEIITNDLEQHDAAAALQQELASRGFVPGILVNNAGFGLNGAFGELDRGQQLALIDLNIRALTQLTHIFLSGIIEARGAILNVASVASFFPGPGMAAYYASKAYVLSFGEALSYELKDKGERVSTLCPGPTKTGFMQRAGIPPAGEAFYTMQSMPVAECGYAGLMRGQRVIVPGWLNRTLRALSSITPHRISMRGIARMQFKRRRLRHNADQG